MSARSKLKAMGDARKTRARAGVGAARERTATADGTRERLLEVGRQLFAERGYHHVTVRDISQRASANLAAVGYHFGDKLSLYRAVVEGEIAAISALNENITSTEGATVEDRIRHYVHQYLPRMLKPEARIEWIQRLFRHEMAQPTPIAQEIADKILRPRMRHLAELVAEALDSDLNDRRVQLSAFSIQSQCMFYVRDSFRSFVFSNWPVQTPEEIRAAAEHIADFSIAGIRALAGKSGSRRGSGSKSRPRVDE